MYMIRLKSRSSPACKEKKMAFNVCVLVLCVYNLQMAAKYMKPLMTKNKRSDGLPNISLNAGQTV